MIGFPACNTPYQFHLTCPLPAFPVLNRFRETFCKLTLYWIVQDVAIFFKKRTLFEYNFMLNSESFKNTDWLFGFERQDQMRCPYGCCSSSVKHLFPHVVTIIHRHKRKLQHSGKLDTKSRMISPFVLMYGSHKY